MKFVLASHNQSKLQEVRDIMEPLGFEIESIPEGFPEIEETGDTFEKNAKIKARAVCKAFGIPAIADDSGLEVDALDGFPGIKSARWAGSDATSHDRNQLLLERMKDVPEDKRGAEFICVAACVFPNGAELAVRGQCRGTILKEERGTGGFGYDPIFCVPKYSRTFGELDQDIKNSISHRARAFTALGSALAAYAEKEYEE